MASFSYTRPTKSFSTTATDSCAVPLPEARISSSRRDFSWSNSESRAMGLVGPGRIGPTVRPAQRKRRWKVARNELQRRRRSHQRVHLAAKGDRAWQPVRVHILKRRERPVPSQGLPDRIKNLPCRLGRQTRKRQTGHDVIDRPDLALAEESRQRRRRCADALDVRPAPTQAFDEARLDVHDQKPVARFKALDDFPREGARAGTELYNPHGPYRRSEERRVGKEGR